MKYHLLQLFTNSYIIDVAHYNFIPQSSLLDSGLFLKLELINICIHMCMFVCLFSALNIAMYVHSFIIICFYFIRSKHSVIIIRLHCSASISIHFCFLITFTHSLLSFFSLIIHRNHATWRSTGLPTDYMNSIRLHRWSNITGDTVSCA